MPERVVETPFRWVGGKQRLAGRLAAFVPPSLRRLRYVEPFMGGGSLFFRIRPPTALLADVNSHLIAAYDYLRQNPARVAAELSRHGAADCEGYYYIVRSTYNRLPPSAAQAARFLYLNRTCFNGIFRVNRFGHFNVPYGFKSPPWLPSRVDLLAVARLLRRVKLRHQCFRKTLQQLDRTCFVYLDPPYPPLNGTSFFNHYTVDRFGAEDHEELATAVRRLDRAKVKFLMSNADTPTIRKLYAGFSQQSIPVSRYVSCKNTKHAVRELVIKNF